MTAPAIPAAVMDATMDSAITSPSPSERLHNMTASAGRDRDRHSVHRADDDFLHHDLQPVMQADFAQCQPAHGHGECLRAGVAGLPGHHRKQDGERGVLGDGALEQPHHRSGEERGHKVDLQPGKAFAHREERRRERAFVPSRPDHRHQVARGRLLRGFDEFFLAEDTQNPVVEVDHRQAAGAPVLQGLDDLIAGSEGRDSRRICLGELLEEITRSRQEHVLEGHRSEQAVVVVDQEHVL